MRNEKVILDNLPAGTCYHDGGRLKLGPDGLLYFTDGGGFVASRAADRNNMSRKIMRIKTDGSGFEVFAWGFRNPQGLAWDPPGHLYASNHGPTGDFGLCCNDSVDYVQQGDFYGWPAWAGNTRTGYSATGLPDYVPPIVTSGNNDTWAPSGIAFYSPRASERPALYMAELEGTAVRRFVIERDDPSKVSVEKIVFQGAGRMRDVTPGPDHCLYLLTSNRDGRGSPSAGDDKVIKLCPQ